MSTRPSLFRRAYLAALAFTFALAP
ncbi:MAG: hypothetical protein RLZZ15_3480, partial [Verrucomicrobiota bacterium]